MQARIRSANQTDHTPSGRYLELSMHHQGFPDWEWAVIPTESSVSPRDRMLIGLSGVWANMRHATPMILDLSDEWTTLDDASVQWVHQTLFTPLINHVDFFTKHVRNFGELCAANGALYEPLCKVREQALRDRLFTLSTTPQLSGCWMRSPEAMPETATAGLDTIEAYLVFGFLEIYDQNGRDLMMMLEIHRWADGIYWMNDADVKHVGAIIPGSLLLHLDSLSSGTFWTSTQPTAEHTPIPMTLHPELQQWLTETFLWHNASMPHFDELGDYLLQQAHELTPDQPGLPGRQYSKRIAYARIIENTSLEDIEF